MVGRIKPFASLVFYGIAEMHGVPVADEGGEQVESSDPVVLAFDGGVAQIGCAHLLNIGR